MRSLRRLFWQILIFMTAKVFRDGSLNFFSYDEKYLVRRSCVYVPVDSNV